MTLEQVLERVWRDIIRLENQVNDLSRDLAGLPMYVGKPRDVTIAVGIISVTFSHYRVVPETGIADDLVTINGGRQGKKVVIQVRDAGDTITVKDGIGNIDFGGTGDRVLSNQKTLLVLLFDEDLNVWLRYPGA